jgi:carbon-monoxide dehydrogenase large subunit
VEKVRYVGEAVALVVAETLAIAKNAAELIEIDYELLPAVTDVREATEPNAPLVWEGTRSNVFLDAEIGDEAATVRAFTAAAYVVSLETHVQRVTGVPMEARTAVGNYDAQSGRYYLHAGSGGVVRQKGEIATMLGIKPEQVRVVALDIGGNFGTKNSLFPEFPLVLWASRRVGRPVKWVCERSEAFVSDYHGRDLAANVELALDAQGRFLAMRGTHLSNIGAYASSIVSLRKGVSIFSGLYRVPAAHYRACAVLTHTMPTTPYRSAGRPEAMFVMERLCDLAAAKTGIDRIEIRRRNLIAPDELPYRTAFGVTYDNGNYAEAMEKALALSDWSDFPKRRAESKKRGRLRGIGLANYIELTMGYPREWSRITVRPEGEVEVAVGTLSSGQGHETSFAQCVSEWLGVPFDQIRLVQGDTDVIPIGGGSHSGRSMRMAGVCMGSAATGVLDRSRRIAAHMFEIDPEKLEFANGGFKAPGSGRTIGLFETARAAQTLNDLDDSLRGPLATECDHSFTHGGYPYGCAVCEVEIEPATGLVEITRYCAVDDVGRAVNPMILEGQTHGAIAQGVGQAFWEQVIHDRRSGQVLTGSFMDYAMPRADNLPSLATELMEIPSPTNPLGIRAGGEGGTTPALAAAINAIVDALAPFGVTHMEMPATPERVWRTIRRGKAISRP